MNTLETTTKFILPFLHLSHYHLHHYLADKFYDRHNANQVIVDLWMQNEHYIHKDHHLHYVHFHYFHPHFHNRCLKKDRKKFLLFTIMNIIKPRT